MDVELGLATFADLSSGVGPQQRMRDLLKEAELAEQVAEKILFEHELFGNTRYVGQMSLDAVRHPDVLRSIELFGTEVAPVVRAEVQRREAARTVVSA